MKPGPLYAPGVEPGYQNSDSIFIFRRSEDGLRLYCQGPIELRYFRDLRNAQKEAKVFIDSFRAVIPIRVNSNHAAHLRAVCCEYNLSSRQTTLFDSSPNYLFSNNKK